MRILHVGSGFRPWRSGGLVAYIEDLMDEQVRRGYQVAYFFSGRQYPLLTGPRLRRWNQRGVAMLEVLNSPLYDHGRQPELEQSEPRLERMFERALRELRPDAVHVQELAGLPSSLLDVVHASGTPTVVTLQDYFPVCSAFKLLDAEGQVCTRREIGADCAANVAADPRDPGILIDATLRLPLRRVRLLERIDPVRRERYIRRFSGAIVRREIARRRRHEPQPAAPPVAYQRRRELNIERLNRADRVIAMSHRVEQIYARLGVHRELLQTVQLTLAHIEHMTPRRASGSTPVTFATLAGFESEAKGALLLLEAVRRLERFSSGGDLRLIVFGHVADRFREQAERVPGIDIRGPYAPHSLDSILDEVDVGIVPSVWEEAYAYAGVEFLAKGIPVVGNAIGGIPDYTRDGETGWLNRSCSADELARIMAGVIERPEQVAELNARLIEARDSIVKPVSRHASEMDAIYRELIGARGY